MGYRSDFEKHFDVVIPKGYEVHHINLNHNDNSMENLMILPCELHREYHRLVGELDRIEGWNISTKITCNCGDMENYKQGILEDFLSVLRRCSYWADYMRYLQGDMINVWDICFPRKSAPDEWR